MTESTQEFRNLLDAMKAAWSFASKQQDFGRHFIIFEALLAVGAIAYSIATKVTNLPPSALAISGVLLVVVSLGELQLELAIKQSSVPSRDAIFIGYKTISRVTAGMVFSAAMLAL